MAMSVNAAWMDSLSSDVAAAEQTLEDLLSESEPTAKCTLLSGRFDVIVQVVLALGAFGSLLVKRHYERPRRSLKVWSLDTAKQGASAGAAHVAGMLIALIASHDGGDQCAFYLITFTIDTTLGVFIGYTLLRRLQALARKAGWTSLSSTGNYGTPVQYSIWAKQMVTWCLIVVVARACCGMIVISLRHQLTAFSETLASPFDGHPKLFLLTVMLACPVCMNVAQLWVQDAFLKKGGMLSRKRLRGGLGGTPGRGGSVPDMQVSDGGEAAPIDADHVDAEARPLLPRDENDDAPSQASHDDADAARAPAAAVAADARP